MRIPLKNLNSVRKKLANGTIKTYRYAWKGGPPLTGEPGTPEFFASYTEAVARRRAPERGTLQSIIHAYQQSEDFRSRADSTRRGYLVYIKRIEAQFGALPLAALTDRRVRGKFMEWRDQLAQARGRRTADYGWSVLALILAWAFDRGLTAANPCERGGRLYRGSRRDKVWTDNDEAAFLASAPAHLHLPLLLALWTGQRQGDLLRLPWSAYDGTHIRLKQSKTGERVSIPVGAPLKVMLDATLRRSPIILLNSEGRPWTSDGFRVSWRKAQVAAGVRGVTFHDLRGTAVTRLAVVGCSVPQVAAVTGHTLASVHSILAKHYLHRDPALAESAIRMLERGQILPTALPTAQDVLAGGEEKAL